jgi:tetratricopeptide (TPR) repeat protein
MEKELQPLDRDLRSARAAWYSGANDFAQEICLRLFKAHGFQEKILIFMGEIALKEGKLSEAHAMFDIVLRTSPNSLVAKHRLAATYIAENNLTEAAPMLNELVVSNPLNINVLHDAGQVNLELGDHEHAATAMNQMLKLDKKDVMANQIMAKISLATGQVADACKFLQSSHSDLEMVQFLNNAGAKLSKENDLPGAIKLYLQCLDIIKSSQYLYAIHYNLGLAYSKQKLNSQAVEHFKKALLIKPDFEKARLALEKLQAAS